MPHLGPFHLAAHRVHHDKPRAEAAAAKSHPVRDIDFTSNRFGGDLQIAHPKKPGAEKQPLHFR